MAHHRCPAVTGVLPVNKQKFDSTIILLFDDGSLIQFNYAHMEYVHIKEGDYLDVYTEHCGYHRFFAPAVVSKTVVKRGL